MILFLQLILAHLIGDFILQPRQWVVARHTDRLAAWQLYAHAGIHIALMLLFTGDWTFWYGYLALGISHLLIDLAKAYLQNANNQRWAFLGDQCAHIACILLFIWVRQGLPDLTWLYDRQLQLLIGLTAVVFLTLPASVMIKIFISKWNPENEWDASLRSAGMYIGFLERILVFLFTLLHHWEAVGFLITAKSVFRFGDLKAARDRKLTEYVLIGTLSSFGIAIVTAVICDQYIHLLDS